MHVLIAPTAFKGTLSASEAAHALAEGWRRVRPNDDLTLIPVGDGGDGSLDMLCAAVGAVRHTSPACDALGRVRDAPYAILPDGSAFIETAAVVGIAMLDPAELDIMRASTAGLGDLISHLLDRGIRRIAIGVGGTASHDVGIGMLAALGVRFDGVEGDLLGGGDLARIQGIDLSMWSAVWSASMRIGGAKRSRTDIDASDALRHGVHFTAICDVECPVYGPDSAAVRFAPQKGASPEMVRDLNAATAHFAHIVARDTGLRLNRLKYGGAGGALAAGLHLGLDARLVNGAEWLIRRCRIRRLIAQADVIVTGEGRFDETSLHGKAAYRLATIAHALGKPVLLATGILGIDPNRLADLGFADYASVQARSSDARNDVSALGQRLAGSLAPRSNLSM